MFALFAATTLRLFFKLRQAVAHLFALTVDKKFMQLTIKGHNGLVNRYPLLVQFDAALHD